MIFFTCCIKRSYQTTFHHFSFSFLFHLDIFTILYNGLLNLLKYFYFWLRHFPSEDVPIPTVKTYEPLSNIKQQQQREKKPPDICLCVHMNLNAVIFVVYVVVYCVCVWPRKSFFIVFFLLQLVLSNFFSFGNSFLLDFNSKWHKFSKSQRFV